MSLKLYSENNPIPKEEKHPSPFHSTGNKIHFISLGCPRNLVDTEVMIGILLQAGYEASPELDEADYIVINTCGFLEASRNESVGVIQEALAEKKQGAKVIATRCMVQTHSDEIKEQTKDVDFFLGSGDVEAILTAIEASSPGEEITTARSYLEAGEVPRVISTPKHYAYLKIAEGCRKRCAYCIIPTIKGPLKSKSIERIVNEFRILLDQGVKEIILIAQDLGDFGKDVGYKRSEGLLALLQELLKEKREFWLRLLYVYPDEITQDLIQLMKSDRRICPYIDMPIQHINNDVLKAMHRATNKEQITELITTLRAEVPDISIRTSLIVGFPGETEEQFEELAEFLQKYPLDHVGIFEYSKEEGSHAANLSGHHTDATKRKRQEKLATIQQEIVAGRNKQMIGKIMPALVEGYHPESDLLMIGRHRGQCPDIDSQVIINDGRYVDAFGEIYIVEITDVAGYDLIGQVTEKRT